MPITPSILKSRRAACSFDYMGETVNIEYYPAAIDPETVTQLRAWVAKANALDDTDEDGTRAILVEFGAWIAGLIAAWDYCEDDAVTPVPLTPERLADELVRFPDFLIAVIMAALQDRSAGNANGTTPSGRLGATSSRTGSLTNSPAASSQNRYASSSRRAGSRARRQSNG